MEEKTSRKCIVHEGPEIRNDEMVWEESEGEKGKLLITRTESGG